MTSRARPALKTVAVSSAASTRTAQQSQTQVSPDTRPAGVLDDRGLARLTGYNVARTNLRMMRAFQVHVGCIGLKPAEYSALVLIAANPGINQKQLGDALDISAPNLAVMLDQLSARGLLARVRSAVDRRLQHPQLTAAGEKLLTEAERCATGMEAKILETLTPGERAILIELLQKLSA